MRKVVPAGLKAGPRIRALRAFSFPLSLLPVIAATASARPVTEWDWGVLAGSLALVMFSHAAGNLLNDCFDYAQGVDRPAGNGKGRSGVLSSAELSVSDVAHQAVFCVLLGAAAAAYLAWKRGACVLWFTAPAMLALYAYTGPPFRLKHHALGEVVIFVTFGPALMLGAAYAQTGQLEWKVALLSVPVGFATTAVLAGNNLRDFEEDRQAGLRTLAHALGRRGAGVMYVMLMAGSALGIGAIGALGLGPRPLILVPILLPLHLPVMLRAARGKVPADIDANAARFESVLLAVVIAAYVARW